MFTGCMVALITPMHENGVIDYSALEKLVALQLKQGCQGIVVAGTTGEGSSLTLKEYEKVIDFVIGRVQSRVPVIVGTGTNCTTSAIERTKLVKSLGADAALVVTPFYNRPTQEGLFLHYQAIAKETAFPILIYNVPSRTAVDILPETVERLAEIDNIVGIKEAVPDSDRYRELLRRVPEDFHVFSGDDKSAMGLMLAGGAGVISVTANVAPSQMRKMTDAALAKDGELAVTINEKLNPLHDNLFIETNPIPVKWALSEMGLISPGLRLPLTNLSQSYEPIIRDALAKAGIAVPIYA